MNELEKKYRAAPRQVSPARLDDLILERAAQKVSPKRRSSISMAPWKTMAASFCVVGLGVTLLMRFGLPPLSQYSGKTEEVATAHIDSNQSVNEAGQQNEPMVLRERNSRSGAMKADTEALENGQGALAQQPESPLVLTPDLASETQGPAAEGGFAETAELSLAQPPAPPELSIDLSTDSLPESSPETARELRPPPLEKAAKKENNLIRRLSQNEGASALSEDRMPSEADSRSDSVVSEFKDSAATSRIRAAAPSASFSTAPATDSAENSIRLEQRQVLDIGVQLPADLALRDDIATPLIDGLSWIEKQSNLDFTLQLATAPESDYLIEFGQSLNLAQGWTVLELVGNHSDDSVKRFGLFYGVFNTADEALLHIAALDKKASKFNPWVRSFSKLRKEVTKP